MDSNKHVSILLNEVIDVLNIKADGIYVDGTLGMAGHSSEILKKIDNGILIGFDKDKYAIDQSYQKLSKISKNFKLVHSDFSKLKEKLEKLEISKIDGLLLDLGVSSPQLDNADRGFSYSKDNKLDMRMNQDQELSAWNVVNEYNVEDLSEIFKKYGESKFSWKIANNIIQNRPINTTLELVEVIKSSLPSKVLRQKNPSKAIFQAIRIEVNNELNSIKEVLSDAIDLLKVNGVIAVITFHSIEDKIVKSIFKELISDNTGKLPIIKEIEWVAKQKYPTEDEQKNNKRARSAKLRWIVRRK
ncbi:MAG: 16S rRNA (cytosine(1402)-N(4))-methyltransferase RsmH [Mycoplasma sp.]|nr:16S rRNA (cytosine(1402)-N(4))-methyltransferase RsmH [Mycoplasma sp.]